MYTILSANRREVKVTSMSKMNVKPNRQQKRSSAVISDEERKKRYYYNQLKKRREVIDAMVMNFKDGFSCFVTLTVAEEAEDIEEGANVRFEKFTKNMRRTYKNFRYVATIELQDRGAIHYHLVCNIPDEADAIDSILRYWGYGDLDVQMVYDIQNLSEYVTKKFLEQDDTSPLFGKRCYKCSQHLEKPFVVYSWNMKHEDFEAIKNALTENEAKNKVFRHHEKAGDVEYSTYELCSNGDVLFNEYTLATRKRLQF